MTEEQIKFLCKWAVEYGNRPFTRAEKESIKIAIDKSNTPEELLAVAFATLAKGDLFTVKSEDNLNG